MKSLVIPVLGTACLLTGCVVDQYGRTVPPDPIGQAIFNVLNPPPVVYTPVYQPAEYVVAREMPPIRYERRPPRPRYYADPVYIGGYWGWGGNDWAWNRGRWLNRPRPGVRWVGDQYYVRDGRRYWRSGYWR